MNRNLLKCTQWDSKCGFPRKAIYRAATLAEHLILSCKVARKVDLTNDFFDDFHVLGSIFLRLAV
jgi:hypothetical protein